MKKTQTKKTSILSVLCYILAALFFLYGVYMLIYSIDYIQSYESTGLIDTQNVIQYVVTSSASYLGFAVLLFAGTNRKSRRSSDNRRSVRSVRNAS